MDTQGSESNEARSATQGRNRDRMHVKVEEHSTVAKDLFGTVVVQPRRHVT
jgi:hypothetical protein